MKEICIRTLELHYGIQNNDELLLFARTRCLHKKDYL